MLAGMIQLLRSQHPNLPLTVFSNDPQDTQTRHAVPSIGRLGRLSFKHKVERYFRIFQNRCFILGGGDLLRDSIHSSIAANWLHPLQQAIKAGCRTIVLGISVGEVWRPETKALIPQVLNQVDLIAVRDCVSKTRLEELGVQQPIHVISDLALQALPIASELNESSAPQSSDLQVGLSMRHLINRGRSTDTIDYSHLLQEIAATVDFLIEQYGATIHFLPLRTYKDRYHPIDDDYVSILKVLQYSRHSSQVLVHRYFDSLQEFNQLVSQLDFVIGMRLHSLILAAGLGVPVLALEYDAKVQGFMKEIGQSELSVPLFDCYRHQLVPLVENVMGNLSQWEAKVQAGMAQYRQRITAVQPLIHEVLI